MQDVEGAQMARERLAQFERDFNRGALASLIEQYDASFIGILGPDLLDYGQYIGRVREMLTARTRPNFRLEIHEVRSLDGTHVLANGVVYTAYPQQTPEKKPFTVIYARSGAVWRLIYSHS